MSFLGYSNHLKTRIDALATQSGASISNISHIVEYLNALEKTYTILDENDEPVFVNHFEEDTGTPAPSNLFITNYIWNTDRIDEDILMNTETQTITTNPKNNTFNFNSPNGGITTPISLSGDFQLEITAIMTNAPSDIVQVGVKLSDDVRIMYEDSQTSQGMDATSEKIRVVKVSSGDKETNLQNDLLSPTMTFYLERTDGVISFHFSYEDVEANKSQPKRLVATLYDTTDFSTLELIHTRFQGFNAKQVEWSNLLIQ